MKYLSTSVFVICMLAIGYSSHSVYKGIYCNNLEREVYSKIYHTLTDYHDKCEHIADLEHKARCLEILDTLTDDLMNDAKQEMKKEGCE